MIHAAGLTIMKHFVLLGLGLCLFPLPSAAAEEEWLLKAGAPIVPPGDAERVVIPETLQKAAREFGLDLSKVSAFHEPRNILELSYYGERRGVPLPHKTSVLVENGGKRFWLADQFPHPNPTTVVGPFEGDAIEKLNLLTVLREGMVKRNYSTQMQAISGLLSSDDAALAKLGLTAVSSAMDAEPSEVDSFLHFIERSLPKRRDAFAKMGLAKQTEDALASMEQARQRVAAVTVEGKRPIYQAGYDPTKEQRHGIGVLPEEAWGEENDGLQAALTAPEELELNQRVKLYYVFRNVSDATVRVSFPEVTGNLHLSYKATPHLSYGGTEGLGGHRQSLTHWSLEPGHQAAVLCRPLQIMKEGELQPKHAFENGKPGALTLWAASSSRDEWRYLPDDTRKLVTVPAGDWKGYLKTGIREVTLLDAAVPFEPIAPPELGRDHGLELVRGHPAGLDSNRATAVPLRAGAYLYLQNNNEHWLVDHETYNTTTSWGPMSAARLRQLGLLDRVEKDTRALVDLPAERSEGFSRLVALVQGARPLALLGLQLVPELKIADANPMHPRGLARTIRNRRTALIHLGLEKELRTALDLLSAVDPPLPPIKDFTVVADREIPRDLPAEAWGPENDGLRAAALLPKIIKDGSAPVVRLFLRNTSDHDIYLTVADRPGYDYATATDLKGTPLPSKRPLLYPNGFSGFISPEIDPGLSQQNPPLANLIKLLLKPGAVYELKTVTSLGYAKEIRLNPAGGETLGTGADRNEPALTSITTPPTEALVTWHLHTTNGIARDLKTGAPIWPAKGGWSGPLETAAIKVTLAE